MTNAYESLSGYTQEPGLTPRPFCDTPLGLAVEQLAIQHGLREEVRTFSITEAADFVGLQGATREEIITDMIQSNMFLGVKKDSYRYYLRGEHLILSGLLLKFAALRYSKDQAIPQLHQMLAGSDLDKFLGETQFLKGSHNFRGNNKSFRKDSEWNDIPFEPIFS